MDIKNIQDLNKIITICRKKGIEAIKIGPDSIEVKFTEQASLRTTSRKTAPKEEVEEVPPVFTPEDILFWSSAGIPEPKAAG